MPERSANSERGEKIESLDKTILYDGVKKNLAQLLADHRRYTVIFLFLCLGAMYATYWAFGAGGVGFIAFILLILPTYVIAFVYFSKIRSNKLLIGKLRGEYVDSSVIEDPAQIDIPISIKKSNPFMIWLLVWFTGGIYFFVWLYKMMSNLNEIYGKPVFNIGKIISASAILFVIYIILLYFHVRASFPESGESNTLFLTRLWLLSSIAVVWILGIVYFQVKFSKYISVLQSQLGLVKQASVGGTILLFFLGYASVPYVQSQFNSLVVENAPNKSN